MNQEMRNDNYIFISYAHENSKMVVPIIQRIRNMGYQVWIDNRQNLPPGSFWSPEIRTAVDNCHVFLAFFSKAYFKSDYCKYELQEAINNNLLIQTIYIDDVKLPRSYAACDRTQNLYLGECSSWNEFYSFLQGMQGLSDCKSPYAGNTMSTVTDIKVTEKVDQSVRAFTHRNKKNFIKIGVATFVFLLLAGFCVWKGREVVPWVVETVNDKLGKETEFLTETRDLRENEENILEVGNAKVMSGSKYSDRNDAVKPFTINPDLDGYYAISLDGMTVNNYVHVQVLDPSNQEIASWNCSNNQFVLLEDLRAQESYTVYLTSDEPEAVNFSLWKPKEVQDLSSYTGVKDSIEFYGQKNCYQYNAETDGTYYISFQELSNNAEVYFAIFDSNHNDFSDGRCSCGNNEGIRVEFKKGETYYFEVTFNEVYSPYTLCISKPEKTENISNCKTVYDSLNYESQTISYEFIAEKTGRYLLNVKDMKEDQMISLRVCNDSEELYSTDLSSGGRLSVEMTEGQRYYIYISQKEGYGDYTLELTEPHKTKGLTVGGKKKGTLTNDSQRDEYKFKAKPGSVYTVNLDLQGDHQDYESVIVTISGKTYGENSMNANECGDYPIEVNEAEDIFISVEQNGSLNGNTNKYVLRVKKEKIKEQ